MKPQSSSDGAPRGPKRIQRGIVRAAYREPTCPIECHNPFLLALPEIRSEVEVFRDLGHDIPFSPSDRERQPEERAYLISQIPRFYEPLPMSIVLFRRIERMIRLGYAERNPTGSAYPGAVERAAAATSQDTLPKNIRSGAYNSAISMFMLGVSGIGKSTTTENTLDQYPRVIIHREFEGEAFPCLQLVSLKVNCPHAGSLRGLLISLILEMDNHLGTEYERRYLRSRLTVDELIPVVARLFSWHGLGMLVIDEIQDLSSAASGGDRRILNFFVQLINTVKVPVILVGTFDSIPIFTPEFRMARRGTGQGDLLWNYLADRGGFEQETEREVRHQVFKDFCITLWKYQYVREPVELSGQLLDALYEESGEITDIIVKLFTLTQLRAIDNGRERITPDLIRETAREDLRLVRETIRGIREREVRFRSKFSDLLPGETENGSDCKRTKSEENKGPRDSVANTGGPPVSDADANQPAEPPAGNADAGAGIAKRIPKTGSKKVRPQKAPSVRNQRNGDKSLLALIRTGQDQKRSAYETLKSNGMVRDLSAEVRSLTRRSPGEENQSRSG